jgi:KUP system potassium uptake protein
VYVPAVNAGLLVAVVFLVLFFRSSERLTDAYGLAVACTMVTTSVLMFAVCRTVWGWSRLVTACVATPFFVLDCLLLAANVPKIPTGGWFPVSVGVLLFVTMSTWRRGRELAAHHVSAGERLERFLRRLCERDDDVARVPGTAVYPGSLPGIAPAALVSNVAHNHVLHRTVIVFANVSESAPRADENERIETRDLGNGCFEVVSHHGFTERPNLPRLLASLEGRLGGWRYDAAQTTFYLPRDEVAGSHAGHRFSAWRQRLFAFMSYHSATSADYYGLAAERVVELGVQVVL